MATTGEVNIGDSLPHAETVGGYSDVLQALPRNPSQCWKLFYISRYFKVMSISLLNFVCKEQWGHYFLPAEEFNSQSDNYKRLEQVSAAMPISLGFLQIFQFQANCLQKRAQQSYGKSTAINFNKEWGYMPSLDKSFINQVLIFVAFFSWWQMSSLLSQWHIAKFAPQKILQPMQLLIFCKLWQFWHCHHIFVVGSIKENHKI